MISDLQMDEYLDYISNYSPYTLVNDYESHANERLDLFSLGKELGSFINTALSLKPGMLSKTSGIEDFIHNDDALLSSDDEYNSRWAQFFRLMFIFTEQVILRRPTAKIALSMFDKYLANNFKGAMEEYKAYLESINTGYGDEGGPQRALIPGPTVENALAIEARAIEAREDPLFAAKKFAEEQFKYGEQEKIDENKALEAATAFAEEQSMDVRALPTPPLPSAQPIPRWDSPGTGGSKKRSKKNKRKNKRSKVRR